LKELKVPIPPLPEQSQIVEELDLLSNIIEKKRQQLSELDNLAQSIFYDMFGDPVMNEKGWEVKKLKDVSTLLNGRAYKQNELLDEGKYKVLRVGNFFTNNTYYYSDLELESDKYCDNGDLLFAWSASFGAFIWDGEKVIYHYHIWKVLFDDSFLNKIFYQYLLNTMTRSFMKDVHGIGMVHLTKVGMEQYDLPLPPLSLQQLFAKKIEAIEKQKVLIKQSIAETEELFNSRMDYYFS
jgi:type I restriction enzyme S subunit